MKDNRFKFEIARHKLINSAADFLHFYSSITRFIRSGRMCSLGDGVDKLEAAFVPKLLPATGCGSGEKEPHRTARREK